MRVTRHDVYLLTDQLSKLYIEHGLANQPDDGYPLFLGSCIADFTIEAYDGAPGVYKKFMTFTNRREMYFWLHGYVRGLTMMALKKGVKCDDKR